MSFYKTMYKKTASSVLVLAALSLVSLPNGFVPSPHLNLPACAAEDSKPICGKPAPDFTLTDTHGKSHKLSEDKGKYVVLEWFNFSCPFVQKHYESGNMQKLQKDYTGKGVVWYSISSSAEGKPGNHTPAEHNAMFKKHHSVPSAILVDSAGEVGHLYDAKTTPDMFVINPEGILIYAGAIDDQPDTEVSSVPGAKNYVKAALDESMRGKPVAIASTKSYGCSVKY
jgi:peroxiredoxin